MKRLFGGAWTLSLLAACGSPMSNGMDAGIDAGQPMPSMLTASGALTGTISAPKPTVGFDAAAGDGTFLMQKTADGPFKADLVIGFRQAPAAMTYSSSSMGFSCNVTVTSGTAAANTWVTRFNTVGGADRGSCSLTFTSATMGANGYDVSGTLSVTAEASGGASSGMVTLMGTF